MADYRELLRRAIQVLPENNGAARRAVYEKARSALVAQLRAIDPPLPAREITQHRLQLEDCIRQVEQEASEAVISNLRQADESVPAPLRPAAPPKPAAPVEAAVAPTPKPQSVPQPRPQPQPVFEPAAEEPRPVAVKPTVKKVAAKPVPEPVDVQESGDSIEAIIAEAERVQAEPPPEPKVKAKGKGKGKAAEPLETEPSGVDFEPAPVRPMPTIVARNETPAAPIAFPGPAAKPQRAGVPMFEPRRESGGRALALQPMLDPVPGVAQPTVGRALSTEREIELDPHFAQIANSQQAIDRAIETLDREARGEAIGPRPGEPEIVFVPGSETPAKANFTGESAREVGAHDTTETEMPPPAARGPNALAIFLVVFVVLLAGAGGAGYWAWREGFVSLDAVFGQNAEPADDLVAKAQQTLEPASDEEVAQSTVPTVPSVPQANNSAPSQLVPQPAPTTTVAEAAPQTLPEIVEEQVPPTAGAQAETNLAALPPEASAFASPSTPAPEGEIKSEERLPQGNAAVETPNVAATTPSAPAADAASLAGSQSLLLEAADNGQTGAVPFSGTVDWKEGKDETGQPTLLGSAKIPARNLGVEVLIRRNLDPSLPASHLMEITFAVPDTFMGGAISSLPGVLLKNEELVQGTPLVGASARVVGNKFLFALTASPEDMSANSTLLTTRKWMDLAVIYATGKRAIITLEKDDQATALFKQVFDAWAKTPVASAQ